MRNGPLRRTQPPRASQLVLLAQAGYYLVGGLVPIALPRIWERLTGPKADWWLVNTVGWLTAVVGATLGAQALQQRPGVGTGVLRRGVALAFIGVDVYYVARRRISRIYLVDAACQALVVVGSLRSPSRSSRSRGGGQWHPACSESRNGGTVPVRRGSRKR